MFIPLHLHSHASLLDGLSKPHQIAERCVELGYTACALTDHGSIGGAPSFIKEFNKKNIKPIIGCEFYCSELDANLKDKDNLVTHQVILARNLKGWYKLIELVSKSNDEENFYYKPRIDINMMRSICDDNLISFSGHLGSTLHLRSKDTKGAVNYIELMKDIFGGNFFIEVQMIDSQNVEARKTGKRMRELAEMTGTRKIATCDAHYPRQSDSFDHQVLLCSSMKTTIKKAKQDGVLNCFFKSQQFHIPSTQEIIDTGSTPDEIENTQLIADMCESYKITGPPKLPKFDCPGNEDEDGYLRQLCRKGWKQKCNNWGDVYIERVKRELDVIHKAGLAGYFLIVQDYIKWSKDQGWLIGVSRGSSGGSLVSYLTGITHIDPIKYDLIFERFYNEARNTKDFVSLPDIDTDFPSSKRPYVIEYLQKKYGYDKVSHMVTFGRLMGKGALKEVLRVNDACSYEEMNTICKDLPQESEISDQLEASGETSIIKWTLENDPKLVSDWCTIDDDGNLKGDYAEYFEQAIRLEGTYKSQGKHPSGIVISAEPLDQVCPMIHDKNSDQKIAGLSMGDLEEMGHVKFDLLNVSVLDKLQGVNNLLMYGKIGEEI